jgi:hypothetical protein
MARGRQRSLLFDLACAAIVLALGVGVLVVVLLNRPASSGPPAPPIAAPPVTAEVLTRQTPDGRWSAWSPSQPTCSAEGLTEDQARVHARLAIQLGMRPECQAAAGTTLGPHDKPPPPGWYLDPRQERGEFGERYWDGERWTTEAR